MDEDKEVGPYEQAKVETRAECKKQGLDAAGLVRRMYELEKRKLEVEDLVKRVNGEYDVLRTELIPDKMQEEGLENMKIAGIGRVSLTADLLVSTRGGKKEALFDWFRANDLDDLLKEDVNPSTLKSFVKNRIKEGKPVPDEFLNVTPFTRASITKK